MKSPGLVVVDRAGGIVETASASSLNDSEVSALSPISTPAVLDNPEALGAGGAIANNSNGVINTAWAAVRRVKDATVIGLQRASVDANGKGTVGCQPGSHVVFVTDLGRSSEASVVGNGRLQGRMAVEVDLAGLSACTVRIARFRDNTTPGEDVLHSVPRETTIAALVARLGTLVNAASVRAINKHLFRKQGSSLNTVLNGIEGFHVGDSGKCPAATALALILDNGDLARSTPVKAGGSADRKSESVKLGHTFAIKARTSHTSSIHSEVSVSALEVLFGNVGELVHDKSGFSVVQLVELHLVHVLTEGAEASSFLFGSRVDTVVLELPLGELVDSTFGVALRADSNSHSACSQS